MLKSIPQDMQAAVLYKPFDVKIETLPVPTIGPNEVLIQVMAVGVCGSDVHYYEHGKIGKYVVEEPIILGHECAGIVCAVGSEVSRVKAGDRVAIEPGVPCGMCPMCKSGRYNLCPDVMFMATPPVGGAFAQYVKHREDFVFRIPDQMSFEEAALLEPYSVGLHATERAKVKPGMSVAIMGMGPVGLLAVVAAKSYGAETIIVSDLEDFRLAAARKLGATHTINIKETDAVEAIRHWTKGNGADVVFETAGNGKALQSGLYSLKRGGKMAIVGLPPEEEVTLNIPFIVDNEIDLFGVFRYANTYETAIRSISSSSVDIKSLVTDKYALHQTGEALERARTNKSGTLKAVVYPNGILDE